MTDKQVRIGVDSSDVNRAQATLRRDAEQLARDMIRSSRQYSTSAKEVLKDIDDQIKAIERRNKLDAEFRRQRVEALRERGGLTDTQYTNQRAQIGREGRQDELQTRLLREMIETIKSTSKEEIREDRRNVEQTIQRSKTVGRLGAAGDEFASLKETIQQDIIGDVNISEATQRRGLNLSRYSNAVMGGGGALSRGDLLGAGRGISSIGGAGLLMAIPMAIGVGGAMAGMDSTEQLRRYMIATQTPATGANNILSSRIGYEGVFSKIGLNAEEGMNVYGDFLRASGGGRLSENQLLTLTSMTRSRDLSPELLGQTVGFQRYSNTGSAATTVAAFEAALRRLYPDEFKRKLVQLPEMIGVYNSLAQQMLQTTGTVNTQALTNFISGVGGGFGVEGVNLQRYTGALTRGFTGSQNNFVRKMQFSAMRQAYGNLGYQETLERLENPTKYVDYMRIMEANMRKSGLASYRSWLMSSGLGATDVGKTWDSNSFKEAFDIMKSGTNKTTPDEKELMNTYYSEAKIYQNDIKSLLDQIKDAVKTEGVKVALSLDYLTSGDFERDFKQLSSEGKGAVLKNIFKMGLPQ